MMNQTHETVLALLRASLMDCPLNLPEQVDWTAVDQELHQQGVFTLCGDVILQLENVPEELPPRWNHQMIQQMRRFYTMMQAQSELIGLLDTAGVAPIILKGTATAAYYPKPEYRRMGDVDMIVRPDQFDTALKLMLENGYQVEHGADADSRHVELHKNGVTFELHRYYAVLNDVEQASAMDAAIYAAMGNPVWREFEGYAFPALPPQAMGLLLLEHVNHHMEEGLGLRQILDWALFVRRHVDDVCWQSEFRAAAQSIGLEKFAMTVTRMCQIYLGLSVENRAWCVETDEELCRELIEYVFKCGEFGCKEEKDRRGVVVFSRSKGLLPLLRNLQKSGCENWKPLKRFPWLKCMAWLYQLCRYVRLGLRRDHPLRRLKDDYRKDKYLSDFLARVGATQRSKGVAVRIGEHFEIEK